MIVREIHYRKLKDEDDIEKQISSEKLLSTEEDYAMIYDIKSREKYLIETIYQFAMILFILFLITSILNSYVRKEDLKDFDLELEKSENYYLFFENPFCNRTLRSS